MKIKYIIITVCLAIILILGTLYISKEIIQNNSNNTLETKKLAFKEKEIILSKDNKWSQAIQANKYDENGRLIKYQIDEKKVPPGYSKHIESNKVINKINTYKYFIEYYFDGVKNKELTEVIEAKYNQEITNYKDKITGESKYKLDKVENLGMKISPNEENNVIKVYYKSFKFNIKLEQTIEKIILNNKEKIIKNNIHKLEIPKKQTQNNLRIYYKIRVTNDSEVNGNTEIYEYIPNGYTSILKENQEWNIHNNIATKKVENLQIGETREYIFIITNSNKNSMPIAVNTTIAKNSTNRLKIEESTLKDNSQTTKCIISTSTGIEKINQIILYITLFILINIALILVILRHKRNKTINRYVCHTNQAQYHSKNIRK